MIPVFKSYRKAHTMIWREGNWKFLLVPISLSVVAFLVLLGVAFLIAAGLGYLVHEIFLQGVNIPAWAEYILPVIIFILSLLPCYFLFKSLVLICYGPFLDRLSEKAELFINGALKETQRPLQKTIIRSAKLTFVMFFLTMLLGVIGFLVGFIPLVGFLFSLIVIFPLQIIVSAIPYLDPYMDRSGLTMRASLKQIKSHLFSAFLFGMISLFISIIPFIGWFVGPTYTVIAGIIYGIYLIDENETILKPERNQI